MPNPRRFDDDVLKNAKDEIRTMKLLTCRNY